MDLIKFVTRSVVYTGLWMVLVGRPDGQELIVGVLGGMVAAGVQTAVGAHCVFHGLHPRRLFHALLYLPYMLVAILRANLDVARRVLDPRLPIRPGIVRVRTNLRHPVARMILANSITLTPGTLTVNLHDDELFIHWVDVTSDDIEQATREIAAGFERYLEAIFE